MAKNLINKIIPSLCLRLIDCILELTIKPFIKKKEILVPQSILITQPTHIGDVILTTSLLPLIKEKFPHIKIGFLLASATRFVMEDHPLIDHIHVIDHWKLNRSAISFCKKVYLYLKSRKKALEELKKIKYDISLDIPFHFPNCAFLHWQANIPMRIGFTTAGFSPLLTHPIEWEEKNQSAAAYFASLLNPLFETTSALKPSLFVQEKEIPFEKFSYMIIHMGTGDPKRLWSQEKWKDLVKLMGSNVPLIFTGIGQSENRAINFVIDGQKNCFNYCDKLSWQEFLLFVKYAQCLIGVETSAGHVAAAFDTPSYLIYTGISHPKLWAPLSDKAKIISFPVKCSPCKKGCADMSCINKIEVESLFKIIHEN